MCREMIRVGVQLLGPHFGEAKLLQIAKAVE